MEQGLFASDIEIEGADRDARAAGHVRHLGLAESCLAELVDGGFSDLFEPTFRFSSHSLCSVDGPLYFADSHLIYE